MGASSHGTRTAKTTATTTQFDANSTASAAVRTGSTISEVLATTSEKAGVYIFLL